MSKQDCVALTVHDGASAQAGVTTRVKLTQFDNAIDPFPESAGVSPDLTNDEIDVNGGGVYQIDVALSLEASAATTVQVHLAADGTEVEDSGAEVDVATGEVDDAHAVVISTIYNPGAPGTTVALSLYVESANSAAILIEQGQFRVTRIDG